MSTKRITLSNEFHNTKIEMVAQLDGQGNVWLSKGQVVKARRALCGIEGCTCGDAAGCRPQMVEDQQDGSARLLEND